MSAATILLRKARDYRALKEEHAAEPEERRYYEIVELLLREVADALERSECESSEAA
jgi:hypothetical protein